ncbi:MAG: zinc ribbon domain-containing protein, partial [Patescibacteria group bacterium]|nr:zinc ribbon domain-containing protein [Patescibacteria group bacterium]
EAPTIGFFNEVFPYFVVIVFLYLGFSLGLQTGAMGAKSLIAGFQAAHKAAQRATLQSIGRTAGRTARMMGREVGRLGRAYQQRRQEGRGIPASIIGTPLTYVHPYVRRLHGRDWRRGLERMRDAIRNEIGIIRNGYQMKRARNIPPEIAMVETVGSYLRERIVKPGWERIAEPRRQDIEAISQMLSNSLLGSRRGILGTIRNVAETGLRAAGVKIPPPRGKFKTCPDCGNEKVSITATICQSCGHVFEKPPEAKPPEAKVEKKEFKTCPNCGAQLEKTALSCQYCGLVFKLSS